MGSTGGPSSPLTRPLPRLWLGGQLIVLCVLRIGYLFNFFYAFFRYFHDVRQLCSGTMFGKHVRGFQEACSTGHYVRQDVRMFEIVRRLNSFVLNPMFECSLNICSDPILVVNVRKGTKCVECSQNAGPVQVECRPRAARVQAPCS